MTKILFESAPHVYLPEVDAYRHYLAAHFPHVICADTRSGNTQGFEPDIAWRFMGMDFRKRVIGKYLVHEYNSLSTNPFGSVKNIIKRVTNTQPDRRIFLNENVQSAFSFSDKVPAYRRDMGIDPQFFAPRQSPKFDFIYVGSLDRGPTITGYLDHLAKALKDRTILLIGSATDELQQRYKAHKNIIFKGRIPYADVPSYMAKARYGLNLMPDIYPFNLQTSTKLLEYCAAGLDIVSSRYRWSAQFAQAREANFFWLDPDFKNLNHNTLDKFAFKTPDVSDLIWDCVIAQSGIFDFLRKI